MKMRKDILFVALLISVFLLTSVSAEKMWNFNNHTVAPEGVHQIIEWCNISDDLSPEVYPETFFSKIYTGGNVGGTIYGDLDGGSGSSLLLLGGEEDE